MNRKLAALFACVLIVMIGFGIALPVMPAYVERLALESGSGGSAAFHIGAVTAAYPLTQLVFAPLWGRLSDRIGRRPLVVLGIVGFAVTQAVFGLANGLVLLYAARVAGGALSSALLPAASAYVADLTSEQERGRGIAWLNTAIGLGTVVGPAVGALLSRRDVHVRILSEHFVFDGFSVPFLVAALLAVAALVAALTTLRESRAPGIAADEPTGAARAPRLPRRLLGAVLLSYIGISIFEATFALFAVARFGLGTAAIGAAFTECGLVMLVVQLAGASLAIRTGERALIAIGLVSMSVGLAVLVASRTAALVFVAVGLLGAGMAFAGPALTSQVSKHESRHVGAALGVQQALQSIGQVAGALGGMLLFDWRVPAPYLVAAALLAGVGVAMARRS